MASIEFAGVLDLGGAQRVLVLAPLTLWSDDSSSLGPVLSSVARSPALLATSHLMSGRLPSVCSDHNCLQVASTVLGVGTEEGKFPRLKLLGWTLGIFKNE